MINELSERELRKIIEKEKNENSLTIPLELARKALSKENLKIIELLKEKEGSVESMTKISQELDREMSNINRNISELIELNIVKKEKEGKNTRISLIHDHLIIEPIY